MRTKRNTADRRHRFLAVLVIALMLITEWHMALAVIGAVMIGLLPMYVVGRHARRNVPAQTEARDRLHSYAEEIYQGHDVVRLSRAVRQVKENFRELNGAVYSTSRRALWFKNLQTLLVEMGGNLSFAAVWIVGAGMVMMGQIDLGTVAVFMLYAGILALLLYGLNTGE
jgi:ATP-binding cassette subfamily B protein